MYKMNKRTFELLLDELKLQVNFAIISVNNFNRTYYGTNKNDLSSEEAIINTYEFWYYLQNYVIAVANISKLLFTTQKRDEDKKEYLLRKSKRDILPTILEVKNNSELENKYMRNTMEHIDEKLEDFSKINPNFVINKAIIPSQGGISINGKSYYEHEQDNLRAYFTDKNELHLLGERYDFNKTFNEVLNLRDSIITVEQELKRGDLDAIFSKSKKL